MKHVNGFFTTYARSLFTPLARLAGFVPAYELENEKAAHEYAQETINKCVMDLLKNSAELHKLRAALDKADERTTRADIRANEAECARSLMQRDLDETRTSLHYARRSRDAAWHATGSTKKELERVKQMHAEAYSGWGKATLELESRLSADPWAKIIGGPARPSWEVNQSSAKVFGGYIDPAGFIRYTWE